jgi:hypothetical protein
MLTVVVPRAKVPLCAMSMTQWTSPDNTDVRFQRPAKVALGFASLRHFLDGQISLIARPLSSEHLVDDGSKFSSLSSPRFLTF